MQTKIYLILCTILLFGFVNSQNVYRKIIHNTDPEAKCLDGSPGALYMHQGTEKDKFLIFMIGGGYCGEATFSDTLQSCYQRSKTMFGSSKLWPQTIDQKFGAQGYISLNEEVYKNWTKVLFAYCDGSLHQGDRENPVGYKDTQLYFRGAKIVRSHFKWLIEKYNLKSASKIILTGGSAGAIGAYLWGNYLQEIVENPDSVYIVPDSGIFLEFPAFKQEEKEPLISLQIQNLMKLAHASQKTPISQCNDKYPGWEWKCLFVEHSSEFLKGKYLFINSQYDTYTIPYILKIDCLKENGKGGGTLVNCSSQQMNYIESYRLLYFKMLDQQLWRPNRGLWSIACSNHVYASKDLFYDKEDEKVPGVTGITVKEVVRKFVFEDQILWIYDPKPWPSNLNCAF